ncbi:hypothetical protein KKC52_11025 [bacterium]|nr:hypothetical protein [bacterium]
MERTKYVVGEIQKRLLGERAKRKAAGNIPPCRTRDGITISLKANVGSLKETEEAMLFGADGIGLLRSELFYLARSEMPSIKEEFEFYKKILQKMPDRTVTIRLLDLGADKNPPYLEEYKESNPQLGCRGIRYLLRNAELFQRHLLSILRASAIAPVHILVPFVATVDDLDGTLMIIDDICQKEVINKKNIQVGIMVEIPSIALSMESWLEKVDFINIGTNDLVQYMFAASREDGGLKDYQQVVHPVMLRIIKNIVFSASNQRKKVTICGEAASDPVWALLLIGLGVRSLSMQPSSIPLVRDRIIEAEYEELKEVARQAMEAHTINEVYAITRQLMEHKGR